MENKHSIVENFSPEKLVLENYTFSYAKKSAPVLKNINFTLKKNDFTCLVGPNGSGKSTLLKRLVAEPVEASKSVSPPSTSSVTKTLSPKEKAKIVSFLPQNETPLWNYTVFETVLQGRFCHTGTLDLYSKKDFEIVEKTLEDFGLGNLKNKSIKEISGGEFQKVRLARCFAQESRFLILDEPLTSLDFVVASKLMAELKEKADLHGIGVLISIHDVNMALRFAKKIAMIGKYDETTDRQFFSVEEPNDTEKIENALSMVYGERIVLKNQLTYCF